MNNRLTKLLVAFFAFPLILTAQPRHCKGLDMAGVWYGTGSFQKSLFISYQRYLSNRMGLKGSVEYSKVNFRVSDYSSYAILPKVNYTIFSNYRNFYLNAKAGGILGFEKVSNEAFGNKTGTYLGESIGSSCEIFISHNLKSEVGVEQRFLQKSLISNYYTHYYLSFYFALN